MKRVIYIPPWLVIIVFLLILGVIFHRFLYHKVVRPNAEYLPKVVENWIEERESRVAPSPVVYKEEYNLKIIEGWTLDNISTYIEELGFSVEDFEKAAGEAKVDYREKEESEWPKDYSDRFEFLESKPEHYGLEGFLFPDSYRVFTDASSEEVVITMLENFDRKLTPELREEIERQGRTIYDIITMASLIEKEAPIDYTDPENTNAKLVSGVFWNRIRNGQALESDATLSYWFNDTNPAHSAEELRIDHPYNSYMYRGFPPTPIGNPGMRAIEAAIYPTETDYNYFLTTLDGSEIYFAETFREHLINKNKYLK